MEHYKIAVFILYYFLPIISVQSEDFRQCWNKGSEMAKNPYFIGNAFTCCNNILMDHPMRPKSEHWRKCMSMQQGNQDTDIPASLWDTYMCELSSASEGAISEDSLTYKKFEAFFMKNYPALVKDKIVAKDMQCEVSSNSTITKKLQTFLTCFLKAEEEVCLTMAGVKIIPSPPVENDRVCQPIESLSKPNHAFETFAQPCCKGEELPYPLFDIFMDFDRFDIAPSVVACSENMKNKLKELNHPIASANDKPFTMCQVACVHEVDGLKGKYNTNFQDLLNFKLKSISNTTKATLISTISKYQPKFQLFGSEDSIPIEEAGNVIAKLDEAQQILNYCKFQFHASAEAYRALYEYCYNAEYGNQFREDIIKM
ncbi:uncharacterized protein LOC110853888 [Folsomia candida]|uniref:DNA ligase n=1 Tax=Folsomia candida TaxID=158441 RepID=A0A226E0F1_FOLCA|nr:uncharacterized protein LOC110853888 [Folsomia candida]OXA50447.1 DNA ligase [Folsomia candida]